MNVQRGFTNLFIIFSLSLLLLVGLVFYFRNIFQPQANEISVSTENNIKLSSYIATDSSQIKTYIIDSPSEERVIYSNKEYRFSIEIPKNMFLTETQPSAQKPYTTLTWNGNPPSCASGEVSPLCDTPYSISVSFDENPKFGYDKKPLTQANFDEYANSWGGYTKIKFQGRSAIKYHDPSSPGSGKQEDVSYQILDGTRGVGIGTKNKSGYFPIKMQEEIISTFKFL